jgi:hypothetical protein
MPKTLIGRRRIAARLRRPAFMVLNLAPPMMMTMMMMMMMMMMVVAMMIDQRAHRLGFLIIPDDSEAGTLGRKPMVS